MGTRANAAGRAAAAAAQAADAASAAARAAASAGEDEDGGEKVDLKLGPLFDLKGNDAERHVWTRIYREEPIDEGHLGDLPAEADRNDIKRRYGGGVFKVQAIDAKKKIIATDGAVKIAGEPIFDNKLAQDRYDRWLRQNFGAPATAAKPERSVEEILALEEGRHRRQLELLKAEADAAVAKAKAEAEAQIARATAEAAARRAEEDERRRRDKADADERAERDRKWNDEQRKRDREWLQLTTQQQLSAAVKTDPLTMVTEVVKVVGLLREQTGSAGPEDPVTAVLSRLPETLATIKDLAATDKQTTPAAASEYDPDRDVLLAGTLGDKAKRAIAQLKAGGRSDDEVAGILSAAFNALAKAKPKPVAAAKDAAAPAPVEASYTPPPKPVEPPPRRSRIAIVRAKAPEPSPSPPAEPAAVEPGESPANGASSAGGSEHEDTAAAPDISAAPVS